jgi:hypothetical protein
MLKVVLDSPFLLRRRVPRLAHLAGEQVQELLALAMPAPERVLRRGPCLTNGQADSMVPFDAAPHGAKPVPV